LLRLEHTPKLVIAAINGHCVGGGLEIAMAAISESRAKTRAKSVCPKSTWACSWHGGTQRLSRCRQSKAID